MDEMPFTPPPPPPLVLSEKQSKIGIASFILGLVGAAMFCIAILIAFGYGISLAANNPYYDTSMLDQSDPIILVATGLICCSPIFNLVGLGLGIAAVAQKTDKKTFGIIGLVINGLAVLSLCVLFAIGLIAQGG